MNKPGNGMCCLILVLTTSTAISGPHMLEVSTTGYVPVPEAGDFVGLDLIVNENPLLYMEDVDIDVLISTTWQGDVEARVINPSGTAVTLINRPGIDATGSGFESDHFGNPVTGEFMRIDDEALEVYDVPFVPVPGIDAVTGRWRPEGGSLSVFDFQSPNGTWRLEVRDHHALDFTTIHGFGISAFVLHIPEPSVATLLALGSLIVLRRKRIGSLNH